ncbi:nitroreductase [Muriicola sp. E247]|uniref:nitroreductase family protein n=1 Tax=Muriicola sp. E247 TaxID=3242730 RepID=UPI003526B144
MIFDLIKNRRAIFPAQYNDKPIEKEVVERILEAANWAPTHRKTEPWRFKVLTGASKESLGYFLSAKYEETDPRPKEVKARKIREKPKASAVVIAICMQRDPEERLPEWEEIAATAMAVQNMWLCCTSLKIGAYWSSPSLIRYMDEFFPLEKGEKCLGFFYMGRYDEEPGPGIRNPVEEKTVWLN